MVLSKFCSNVFKTLKYKGTVIDKTFNEILRYDHRRSFASKKKNLKQIENMIPREHSKRYLP